MSDGGQPVGWLLLLVLLLLLLDLLPLLLFILHPAGHLTQKCGPSFLSGISSYVHFLAYCWKCFAAIVALEICWLLSMPRFHVVLKQILVAALLSIKFTLEFLWFGTLGR